jgi:tryptophanyl-tRNA synthetase
MKSGRVLSGVQPTGNLHLGNYLGAIRQWIAMQQTHECLFCIVDIHAITLPQNPAELRKNTLETAAAYIASGIDPEKSAIYHQSAVSAHSELAWILSCLTPLGWLNRMTQFKEKSGKHKEDAGLGLYAYPVLMAADILIYKATHVPVGEDQKQHLELARDIAGAFNRQFNTEYFPLPQPMILGEATRVMSLRDGKAKMSKSDASDQSRINLTDDAETIANKFKRAKSDMLEGITVDRENRPEATNLLTIYSALADISLKEAEAKFCNSQFSAFKTELADLAVNKLAPINNEMKRLMNDKPYLISVINKGAEKANDIADKHMKEIKELVGFL